MTESPEDLELLAKAALAEGKLPRAIITDFIGGYGAPFGTRCAVCRRLIDRDETTATLAIDEALSTMHIACYHAWQMMVPATR